MSTVLVCDDSPLAREALRRAVATVPGVERVVVAGSGEECLVRFSADRPDLVLRRRPDARDRRSRGSSANPRRGTPVLASS